eukprot:3978958-Amphidinium_carterae.1
MQRLVHAKKQVKAHKLPVMFRMEPKADDVQTQEHVSPTAGPHSNSEESSSDSSVAEANSLEEEITKLAGSPAPEPLDEN